MGRSLILNGDILFVCKKGQATLRCETIVKYSAWVGGGGAVAGQVSCVSTLLQDRPHTGTQRETQKVVCCTANSRSSWFMEIVMFTE
jgi:hypothetical protein